MQKYPNLQEKGVDFWSGMRVKSDGKSEKSGRNH